MKPRLALGLATVAATLLALIPLARGQSTPPQGSGFAPLDQWSRAVIAGDRSALANLYVADPSVSEQLPDGRKVSIADAEPSFWSSLAAQGLTAFNAKILERDQLAQNSVSLVLRVEMTVRPPAGTAGDLKHLVMSVQQTWVGNANASWRINATHRSNPGLMESISLPQPAKPNPNLYPDPADAPQELAEAETAAQSDHKRVLVVFGANWCYDCHVLDATLRSPSVAPLVAGNFHVIHISVGNFDENRDLADRFKVPLNKGIPSLAVLDANGNLITSQKNGEFESAARIGMKDVLGFLNQWKPPGER